MEVTLPPGYFSVAHGSHFNLQLFLRSRRFNWIMFVEAKLVASRFARFTCSLPKNICFADNCGSYSVCFSYNDLKCTFQKSKLGVSESIFSYSKPQYFCFNLNLCQVVFNGFF